MPTEKEFVHWLLGVPTIGFLRSRKLLEYFGAAEAVWHASQHDLENVPAISPKHAALIAASKPKYSFKREAAILEQAGITIFHHTDPDYPQPLLELHDPPNILYVKGEWRNSDEKAIAVVGARQATNYGRMVTKKLAEELAAGGVTIISGMAKGIDTNAHEAALLAGGRTIAVMAGGLYNIYPAHNRQLALRIVQHGALISEFHPQAAPHPGMFPVRNRIISGLSRAVLITEAARKSGSLITADQALDQNRDILSVPGPITSPLSQGTNDLIRQGAKLISSVEDIWNEYPEWRPAIRMEKKSVQLTIEEKYVIETIGFGGVHLEQLLRVSNLAPAELHHLLLGLELKGIIKQMPGMIYMRSSV